MLSLHADANGDQHRPYRDHPAQQHTNINANGPASHSNRSATHSGHPDPGARSTSPSANEWAGNTLSHHQRGDRTDQLTDLSANTSGSGRRGRAPAHQ
ncbi:MAG: hypothetical protein ACRDGF_06290 [Chloroflexota bacterium]